MSLLQRTIRGLVLVLCLGVGGTMMWSGMDPVRAQEKERHPYIHAAIKDLKEARKELKEAAHDFGGHRVKAIEAVDTAIEQLEKCLKFDKK